MWLQLLKMEIDFFFSYEWVLQTRLPKLWGAIARVDVNLERGLWTELLGKQEDRTLRQLSFVSSLIYLFKIHPAESGRGIRFEGTQVGIVPVST